MTLREQIKAIHVKMFNPEFTEYRGESVPAMLNDIALKLFDKMELIDCNGLAWVTPESVDMRAIRAARALVAKMELRANTPAVE